MDKFIVPQTGIYYITFEFTFKGDRLWKGLRTPKKFEVGQYLVTPQGGWSQITEVNLDHVVVTNHNCVRTVRKNVFLRNDIKDGYTRQLNKVEMKLHRLIYE